MKNLALLVILANLGLIFGSKIEVLYHPESLQLKDTTKQLDDLSKFASLCFGLSTESPQDFDGFTGYRNFENIPKTFIAFQTQQSLQKPASSPASFPYDSSSLQSDFTHLTTVLSSRSTDVYTKQVDFSTIKPFSQQIKVLEKEVLAISELKLKGQLGEKSAVLFTFGEVEKDNVPKFEEAILSATKTLRNALNDKVVLININEANTEPLIRRARAAADDKDKNTLNLAYEYSADYHTAFATIGATTVVLLLTVFGVSVAMWNIDPGRDSIIYRLTAQKMKKDN